MAIPDSHLGVTMQLSLAEAKNKLPELIKAVEKGESITICRRGVPVVDIVPTKPKELPLAETWNNARQDP